MNVYEIVTEQVCELLQKGTVPWRKPWDSRSHAPRNLVSGKPYRGINVFLLTAQGFGSPYWLTYQQAQELGGHVKQGAKSTMIVFWKVDRVEGASDDEQASTTRVVLRYYRVFNSEQCELPEKVLAKIAAASEKPVNVDPIADCEGIVANMPKRPVMLTGTAAFYRPRTDDVTLPARASFLSQTEYYSTAFHELGHSTGHKDRLGRKGIMDRIVFGSDDYSQEELVAEMTAAFLCAEGGIRPRVIENQAAYIASWLKVLRRDHKAVVIAAAQAQKAADFIMDRQEVALAA